MIVVSGAKGRYAIQKPSTSVEVLSKPTVLVGFPGAFTPTC